MKKTIILLFIVGLCFSCHKKQTLFNVVEPDDSGIYFSNTITESDSIHYYNFPYIYTGGGVGISDFDNDGLQDIFFSGNMVSSKLYRNKGNFTFEDRSKSSGIMTDQWATGVSIVDIDQDGWMDIYLCVGGYDDTSRKNLLYINNGDLTFTESAEAYGIADDGMSTQAAFFDYDLDGDLDLYIMEHANEAYIYVSKLETLRNGKGPSTDRLYQNMGLTDDGHSFYENVSETAGILTEGYGLGLAISDINQDGWPDVYVANDYIANDLLYINNQDGTFTNKFADYFTQSSLNGMGVDISDINNDALPDILVMDMLPETNERQKTMTAKMNYEHFKRTLNSSFEPQFIRNTLQLNNDRSPKGTYNFNEIGRLAGLHQTDWSWSPLIADFDNDGLKDVHITNGFRRDVTNQDFMEYTQQNNLFSKGSGKLSVPNFVERIVQLDSVCLPNYMFQNKDSLMFENKATAWGMDEKTMSNGSAYADLDNDGDLDLVINNINAPASIYQNNTNEFAKTNSSLKIKLVGEEQNRNAIGAKLLAILPDGSKRYYENHPVHGYMSSISNEIHIGLGNFSKVDTLRITWPDGKQHIETALLADTGTTIDYADNSMENKVAKPSNLKTPIFQEVSKQLNVSFKHQENPENDFRYEPLLLQQYDNHGPGIAVGDMNGDGQEDFYIGNGRNYMGALFFQNKDYTFTSKPLSGSDYYEDMGTLLFDADQDGDLDLYVVSGGSAVKYFSKGHYQDRLYINDGQGNFEYSKDALPEIKSSGSCIVATDFDNDGDLDLFIGGRIVPGQFPTRPNHYLLENQDGKFYDSTTKWANELNEIGMVSAALWTDYDNDLDTDLILVGEWMPITLFENQNGTLKKVTAVNGLESSIGWWNSIAGSDIDLDGDIDYIIGNLGSNTDLKASAERPVRMYVKDFDANSSIDPIITKYIDGKEYPIAPRRALIEQLAVINKLFPSYKTYADADIHKILAGLNTDQMAVFEANYFQSAYVENLGDGTFNIKPLPLEAQFSTTYGLEVNDYDGDEFPDIIGMGNNSQTEVISGWHNAQKGFYLKGDGTGNFEFTKAQETGFYVHGDTRALASWQTRDERFLITTTNNDSLRIFKSTGSSNTKYYKMNADDIWAEITYKNGKKRKLENYWGQGYLSQSSNSLIITPNVASITIYDRLGSARNLNLNNPFKQSF